MTKKQIFDKIQHLPDDMEIMFTGESLTNKLNENCNIEEYREYLKSIKSFKFYHDDEKSFSIFKETGIII